MCVLCGPHVSIYRFRREISCAALSKRGKEEAEKKTTQTVYDNKRRKIKINPQITFGMRAACIHS